MENEQQSYEPQTQQPDGSKDGMATAVLVLGIVSIVCCAPAGIVGLIIGLINKKFISPDKQGMCTAGIVLSIIGIVLWIVLIIVYAIFIGVAASNGAFDYSI